MMPWIIRNGQPVRVPVGEVDTRVTAPEVSQPTIVDVLVCGFCGREYKTEAGLDRHVSDKHEINVEEAETGTLEEE